MSWWALTLSLALLLGLLQLALTAVARGLGRRLDRAAIAAGLVLPFVLLAPWLGPDRLLVPFGPLEQQIPGAVAGGLADPHQTLNDPVFQFIPWEVEVRRALSAGRLPLWSDRLAGGSSPWTNPQAGVLSALSMLTRPLPLQYFLLAALAFKLLAACEGAWLLTRVLGGGRRAAMLAGVSFALGGGISAWGLFPHTRAMAWVPWVVAAAVTTTRRPTRWRVATTALLVAALLLAGHPEIALAGGLLAALCALTLRRPRGAGWRGPAAAAAAALVGFGLAAPQVVPFLAAVPGSHRATAVAARSVSTAGVEATDPATWFTHARWVYWAAAANPRPLGRPYYGPLGGKVVWPDPTAAYAGLLAFGGSLAAFAVARRRRALAPLGLYATGGLLLASQPLPLMAVLYRVPELRAYTFERLLPVVALCLAVLGALGLEGLARVGGRTGSRLRRWGGWAALAAAATLSLAVRPEPVVAGLWLGIGATVVLWRAERRRGWPRGVPILLAALLLADLLPWARDPLPSAPSHLFFPSNPVTEALGRELASAGEGSGPWRAVGQDYLVYPGVLAVYGLADPRPHDPMAPMAQMRVLGAAFDFAPTLTRYFAPFSDPGQPLLDFLNVRAVVSNRYLPPPRGLERLEVELVEPWELWRNPGALPRWFLASGAEAIDDGQLEGWLRRLADPRRVALDRRQVAAWRPQPGAGEVTLERLLPGRVSLALAPAGAGERLLATSLPLPAGWRAEGRRASGGGETLRGVTVNGAFFGAVVPPGVEGIELSFTPPGYRLGWALWGAALLAGGGLLLAPLRRGSHVLPFAARSRRPVPPR